MNYCLYCDKEIPRREDETDKEYAARKYCGRPHSSAHIAELRKIKKKMYRGNFYGNPL